MRIRDFRREDAPRLFAFLKTEFPEEEAMLGMRAEGFEAVVRRLYRADLRLFLGLLRLVGRPAFRMFVAEENGSIAGTTLLTFTPRAGFLSNVVVAPEFRRRGYARALIEAAREATARRGRPYAVLRVLEKNTPARTLYEAAGYGPLDRQGFLVHEAPASLAGAAGGPEIRPFRREDARPLAAIATAQSPPTTREVLPFRARELLGTGWADRLFAAETAGWVVDRGHGAEAHVSATSTPTTEAAHLSSPIVGPSVPPELAVRLVRAAGAWLAARRPVRILASVAEENRPARQALQEAGFREAIALLTLYRSSG